MPRGAMRQILRIQLKNIGLESDMRTKNREYLAICLIQIRPLKVCILYKK